MNVDRERRRNSAAPVGSKNADGLLLLENQSCTGRPPNLHAAVVPTPRMGFQGEPQIHIRNNTSTHNVEAEILAVKSLPAPSVPQE
jgi:hypothetical protein